MERPQQPPSSYNTIDIPQYSCLNCGVDMERIGSYVKCLGCGSSGEAGVAGILKPNPLEQLAESEQPQEPQKKTQIPNL